MIKEARFLLNMLRDQFLLNTRAGEGSRKSGCYKSQEEKLQVKKLQVFLGLVFFFGGGAGEGVEILHWIIPKSVK